MPRDRIHIVHNFAEDVLFTDPVSIDKKFASVSPLRILFLSNLLPGKGASELVDGVLGMDSRERAGIRLDLAGGFESIEQRTAFLNRIAPVPEIQYHGTVRGEQKRQLFNDAHVFCLPTYYAYEGQPISHSRGIRVRLCRHHDGSQRDRRHLCRWCQRISRSSRDRRCALTQAIQRATANPNRLHQIALANQRAAELNYRSATYRSSLLSDHLHDCPMIEAR